MALLYKYQNGNVVKRKNYSPFLETDIIKKETFFDNSPFPELNNAIIRRYEFDPVKREKSVKNIAFHLLDGNIDPNYLREEMLKFTTYGAERDGIVGKASLFGYSDNDITEEKIQKLINEYYKK